MRTLSILLFYASLIVPDCSLSAQEAATEEAPENVIAIGVSAVPKYEGAGDLRIVPYVYADVRVGDVTLQVRGQSVRFDLSSDPRLAIGPFVGARLPRDETDGPIALLPHIDTAVEVGGLVSCRFGGNASGESLLRLELYVVHDVSDTHDGFVATATASYAAMQTKDFFVSVDAQTSWGSADYSRSYFGIDDAGAAASGLPTFSADEGFKDVGASLIAGWWLTQRLGVVVRGGANYLVGDASNSPVTQEGSRWRPAVGVALSYRF